MLCFFFLSLAFGLVPLQKVENPVERDGLRLHIVLFSKDAPKFGRDLKRLRNWLQQDQNLSSLVDADKVEDSWSMGTNCEAFPAWLSNEGLDRLRQHSYIRRIQEARHISLDPIETSTLKAGTAKVGTTPEGLVRPDWHQMITQQSVHNLATIPADLYTQTQIDQFGYPSAGAPTYDPNNMNDFTWSWTVPYQQINTGSTGFVMIADTGINAAHQEFKDPNGASRIQLNVDCTTPGCPSDTVGDVAGHGTHVAGLATGLFRGMAPGAAIGAIRIFSGPDSDTNDQIILRGIQYAFDNRNSVPSKVPILSMSIGGPIATDGPDAVIDCVRDVWSQGLTVVVAAGNEGALSCDYSPAGASVPTAGGVITVGAVDALSVKADFSNNGDCTTVWAPGVQVQSAWIPGPTDYNTIDGTSMATPVVSGALALLATRSPNAGPDYLKAVLYNYAKKGLVQGATPTSNNRYLYSKFSNSLLNDTEVE